MDEPDMSLELLDPCVAYRTFLPVALGLLKVDNIHVLLQISVGCKLFITFITFMTLCRFVGP